MTARYYPRAGPYNGRNVNYRGFDPDKAGIAKIGIGPEVRHAIGDMTSNALHFAQIIAPNDTNEYQSSFGSRVEILPDFPDRMGADPPFPRWVGSVYNDASNAIIVEVGARSTRPYRVFRRTLEWLESVAG
jgi:hypothetical protein